MPIVPISQDISIKTIRDVINLKSIILGQILSNSTTYSRYGADLGNGFVKVKLKNFVDTGYTPVIQLTILKNNVVYAVKTFTLAGNGTVEYNFNSLSTGVYNVKIEETASPLRSYQTDVNLGSLQNIFIKHDYPVVKLSIAKDNGDITSNYQRAEGVNIPNSLSPTNNANVGLREWRGAQVFDGNVTVRSTKRGRYGNDQSTGYITIFLNKDGFSNGNVTVTLAGTQSVTRNLYTSASNSFTFNNQKAGSRQIVIKDTLTGSSQSIRFTVDLSSSNKYTTYSFNGTDIMSGFVF